MTIYNAPSLGNPTPFIDDFKLIHGIGPGIETRLHTADILTYTDLAALSPEEVVGVLGNIVGLTAKRVIDQDWIGQARILARESEENNSEKQNLHQIYEPFRVEFLLNDETYEVRRTRVFSILDEKVKDEWAGWDEARLTKFFIDNANIHIVQLENSPIIGQPEDISQIQPPIIEPVSLPISSKEITGRPELFELSVTSPGLKGHGRIMPNGQPLEINLVLNLEDVRTPGLDSLSYTVTVYGKEISSGEYYTIAQDQSISAFNNNVTLNTHSSGLHEGTYRLTVDLALKSPLAGANKQPDLLEQFDAGYLHIY